MNKAITMIKLTNATSQFVGEPILLNTDFIVSVYATVDEDENKVTMIYTSLQQSWVVKETVDEIQVMTSGGKAK